MGQKNKIIIGGNRMPEINVESNTVVDIVQHRMLPGSANQSATFGADGRKIYKHQESNSTRARYESSGGSRIEIGPGCYHYLKMHGS
jgi:hypothetical protein